MTASLRALHDAALRQGPRGMHEAGSIARGSGPEADAWHAALEGLLRLSEPSRAAAPSPETLARIAAASPDARLGAGLAAAHAARACLLDLDTDGLECWAVQLARLASHGGDDLELWSSITRGWLAWSQGRPDDAIELSEHARLLAARSRSALGTIEAVVLRALAGAGQDAVRAARRAVIMARAEGIWIGELSATLALARVRRTTGRAHHALQILVALEKVAPSAWMAWIALEAMLAGGLSMGEAWIASGRVPRWGPAGDAARALADALLATEAGDRGGYERALVRASEALARIEPYRSALERMATATDAFATPRESDIAAWCRGQQAAIPPDLLGLAAPLRAPDPLEAASAYVVVGLGEWPRRILGAGASLVLGAATLSLRRGAAGRVEAALAALALAGAEGVSREDFFRDVYGFAYVRGVHENILKVLLHRARRRLGDLAGIDATEGWLCLRAGSVLLLPDPRLSWSTEDLALRIIASGGAASARDVAARLRVPLRTVQRALEQLVADGVARVSREAGQIAYLVEDTTFSEGTQRLRPESASEA